MDEKRRSARKGSAWPAVVTNRSGSFPCTILNVSDTGLRVRLEQPTFLGSTCYVKASLFATEIRSKVVWQDGPEIGLQFLTERRNRSTIARPSMAEVYEDTAEGHEV